MLTENAELMFGVANKISAMYMYLCLTVFLQWLLGDSTVLQVD